MSKIITVTDQYSGKHDINKDSFVQANVGSYFVEIALSNGNSISITLDEYERFKDELTGNKKCEAVAPANPVHPIPSYSPTDRDSSMDKKRARYQIMDADFLDDSAKLKLIVLLDL